MTDDGTAEAGEIQIKMFTLTWFFLCFVGLSFSLVAHFSLD